MIDRKTWLNRAKQRALAALESGDVPGAVDVMITTINKHPDTAIAQNKIVRQLGEWIKLNGNVDDALEYIKGFN